MKLNDVYVRCFNLDVNIDVYIFTSFDGFKNSKEREAIFKFDMLAREDLGGMDITAFKLASFKHPSNKDSGSHTSKTPNARMATKLYVYVPEFDMNLIGKV